MDLIAGFLDLVVHLDQHLRALAQNYGNWIYAVLFLIVFLETGLVVTPFLPGDSLLFVAGTIAAAGELHVHALVLLLILAAIIGDSVNYAVGRYVGPRAFRFEDSRFFKRAYLERTHAFFEKHGGKTIVIARFVPIIRTFAPVLAGVGAMRYRRFLTYNVAGGIGWVASMTWAGYLLGQTVPNISKHMHVLVIVIIILSVIPIAVEVYRERRKTFRRL